MKIGEKQHSVLVQQPVVSYTPIEWCVSDVKLSNFAPFHPVKNKIFSRLTYLILLFDINMQPKRQSKPPHKVYTYSKADEEGLKSWLNKCNETFFQTEPNLRSVDDNWNLFKKYTLEAMEKFIPHRMSKSKQSHPWINRDIIRHMRKRDKLFARARKENTQKLWSSYRKQRNYVTKLLRQSYNTYMEDVLGPSLDENPKQFWSFIRSQRREAVGIPTLTVNGNNSATDKEKAEALNQQFTSVFTDEDISTLPTKGNSSFQSIQDLDIGVEGVLKQLKQLNCNKAGGPDTIPARVLHDYADELTPMLHFILCQSYQCGQLPEDWRKALVTAIYKKGSKSSPENYRPVSLTCIACKIMEHIVLSHISKHLSANNVIIDHQHGFREKRSCETQLLEAVHDWSECLNRSSQSDVLLLDFSKAFDKVPHQRLALKLHHYGIRGNTLRWIQAFLDNREQCVSVNGTHSQWSPVKSGVPQGSVLGPTLFLVYINDIVDDVKSNIRLFADDSILYREIRGDEDHAILQQDLNTVFKWADTWQMSFNASKCQLLTITRKTKPSLFNYNVDNQLIDRTSSHKYLGVTITSDMSWNQHIANIRSKACSTLGIIRRNLGPCSQAIKLKAYQMLVRPQLEYAAAAWNPYLAKNNYSLESVQRQAVRYILSVYDRKTSISPLLQQLDLDQLVIRRLLHQCTMFYKIHYNLVSISFPPCVRFHPAVGRAQHLLHYQPIQASRNSYKFSFFIRTIPIWNRLPLEAVTAPSVQAFQAVALPAVRDMRPTTTTHQQL